MRLFLQHQRHVVHVGHVVDAQHLLRAHVAEAGDLAAGGRVQPVRRAADYQVRAEPERPQLFYAVLRRLRLPQYNMRAKTGKGGGGGGSSYAAQCNNTKAMNCNLLLSDAAETGHERNVDKADVCAANPELELAEGLKEDHGLDVADRAADLDQAHVGLLAAAVHGDRRHPLNPVHDLIGDVRDHLYRAHIETSAMWGGWLVRALVTWTVLPR